MDAASTPESVTVTVTWAVVPPSVPPVTQRMPPAGLWLVSGRRSRKM